MLRIKKNTKKVLDPIDYLLEVPGLWRLNELQRRDMTTSCRDTDYIKKVSAAGEIIKRKNTKVQVMHNGLEMVLGGYHGSWMADIITDLKGHHEPQEEKVFYEVLKRLDAGATMIELGSFWSYYSIWFNKAIENAKNICCEPDPNNMLIGKRNAELNETKDLHFVQSAAGAENGVSIDVVMDSDPSKNVNVPIRTVDSLVAEFKLDKLDLLHMDVQGFEMPALVGALDTIKAGKLRFLFVSTHHYFFSGKANTHQECLHYLKENGAHIISSHTIAESFSGDGLIVASFSDEDEDFEVTTSMNHTDRSLFRPYEEDVALLAALYRDTII